MADQNDQIEGAVDALGLGDKLIAVAEDEARRLYRTIENHFSTELGRRWIWESLSVTSVSRQFADAQAYKRLVHIVPSCTDKLLFFPESDEDRRRAYAGAIGPIVALIGECPAFEYCIVPERLEWLSCENHHGVLIAAGEPPASLLRALDDD